MHFSKNDILLIIRSSKYILPYKIRFILSFFCMLLGIAIGLIQPFLWAKVLSSLFSKNSNQLITIIVYQIVLFILQIIIGHLQAYLFATLNQKIVFDLKQDLFKKILDLPIKAFDEMRAGEFTSRLQGDSFTIADILTNQFLNTLVDFVKVVVIGIVIFKISVPLALIVISGFPISAMIFIFFGSKIRFKNKELALLTDDYISCIQESVSGIREIKNLWIKKERLNDFLSIIDKIKNKVVVINIFSTIAGSLNQTVSFAVQVAGISVGGYLIFKGSLSLEYFIAFSTYSSQFSTSIMNITRLNSTIQKALTSIERTFGLIDNLNYSKEVFGSRRVKNIKGIVTFDNVSFKYNDNDNDSVLNQVSFKIQKNKKTAIVGLSGGGKSTIFNLLLKYYEPNSGRILIDNIDIRDFDEQSLRKAVSVVRQDIFLFNLSIKENFLLANLEASDDEIEKACKSANIHDFITKLPNGYNSKIGENSVNLSGGQAQRIAIARAILKNSPIILFDEATSSLDNESQYFVKSSIDELSKGHTLIIIAHRLLTIIDADEIFIVDNGKIIDKGTHSQLILNNDIYKRIYKAELDTLSKSS